MIFLELLLTVTAVFVQILEKLFIAVIVLEASIVLRDVCVLFNVILFESFVCKKQLLVQNIVLNNSPVLLLPNVSLIPPSVPSFVNHLQAFLFG